MAKKIAVQNLIFTITIYNFESVTFPEIDNGSLSLQGRKNYLLTGNCVSDNQI